MTSAQFDDSETSTWSQSAVNQCANINLKFMGGACSFGEGVSTEKTYTSLPPHSEIKITFTIYFKGGKTIQNPQWLKLYLDENLIMNSNDGFDYTGPSKRCQMDNEGHNDVLLFNHEQAHYKDNMKLRFEDTLEGDNCVQYWGVRDIKIFVKPCHYSCAECKDDPFVCSQCPSNSVLNVFEQCECQNKYYPTQISPLKCSECHNSCNTCFDKNPNQCLSCQTDQNQFLLFNRCICNLGFRRNQLGQCVQCHNSCKTCSGDSQNQCLSCYNQAKLITDGSNSYCQCVDGFSQALDSTLFRCVKCHQSCADCDKQNPLKCTVCPYNAILNNNQCVCKHGFYQRSSNPLRCDACPPACATCLNYGMCLNCLDEHAKFSNGKCKCKDGFFQNPENLSQCLRCNNICKTCQGNANFCTSCDNSVSWLCQQECKCLDGYYLDAQEQQCKKCHYTCLSCSGPNMNNCTSCVSKSHLDLKTYTCECDQYYFAGKEPGKFECIICDSQCKACDDWQQDKCTQCFDNAIKINKNGDFFQCKCDLGFFFDEMQKQCLKCDKQCKECTDNAPNSCILCMDDNAFRTSQGICECNFGYYFDGSIGTNGKCVECDKSCDGCDGPGDAMCKQCKGTLTKSASGRCTCQLGQFLSSTNDNQCLQCHSTCRTCTSQLQNQCLSCYDEYDFKVGDIITIISEDNITIKGQCSIKKGYYEDLDDKKKAKKCHQSCFDCNGSSDENCTECDSYKQVLQKSLNGYKCMCKDGFYQLQSIPLVCDVCHESCATCRGSSIDQCIKCKKNAEIVNSLCVCKQGYFATDLDPFNCNPCTDTESICKGRDYDYIGCSQNKVLVDAVKQVTTTVNGETKTQQINYKDCVCKKGYSLDPITLICIKCHKNCASCVYNDIAKCLSCDKNNFQVFYIDRVNKIQTCKCIDGYFELNNDGSQLLCQKCYGDCKTCSNCDCGECTSCDYSRGFVINTNRQCSCMDGKYFDNSPTLQSECRNCTGVCINCDAKCFECDKVYQSFESIKDPTLRKKAETDERAAKLKCMDDPVGTDYLTCIQKFYDKVSQTNYYEFCLGCPIYCLNCKVTIYPRYPIASPFQCPSCKAKCSDCSPRCKTCSSLDICTSCNNNQILTPYGCECPPQTYLDLQGFCQSCHETCASCSGPSENECTKCFQNLFILDPVKKTCKCKPNFSLDFTNKKKCLACSINCGNCQDCNQNACTTCTDKLAVVNPVTLRCECPPGTFYKVACGSIACGACPPNCLECDDLQKCIKCRENAVRNSTLGTCVCQPGFYSLDFPITTCIRCPNYCTSCQVIKIKRLDENGQDFKDANDNIIMIPKVQCLKCSSSNQQIEQLISNYNFDECQCASGYSRDAKNPYLCVKCHCSCVTCDGIGEENCLTCSFGRQFNPLTTKCDPLPGFYQKSSSACVLNKCNDNCKTCKDSDNACDSCGRFMKLTNLKQCECIEGYYFDKILNRCVECNQTCKRCNGPSAYNCQDCQSGNAFLNDNNQCQCKEKYYLHPYNFIDCLPCYGNCYSCLGSANYCTGCVENAKVFALNNKCYCNPGFFENGSDRNTLKCIACSKNCKECEGSQNNCTKCVDDAFLNQQKQCICKPGFYQETATSIEVSQNIICIQCHIDCFECSGGENNKCLSCKDNAYLNSKKQCECNNGFFYNYDTKSCQKCGANCKTCNENGCLTCYQSASVVDNQCVCDSNHYSILNTGCSAKNCGQNVCVQCDSICGECSSKDICITCADKKNMILQADGTCICKNFFYLDSKKQCVKCHPSCFSCTGPNSNDCISCKPESNTELVIDGQNTYCKCISGYYHDIQNIEEYTCVNCSSDCKECNGNSSNSCTQCGENATLVQKQCICDNGYYKDSSSSICLQCSNNCLTCSSFAVCTSCVNNTLPLDESKVCKCKEGYYSISGQCLKCELPCKNCELNARRCTECFQPANLDQKLHTCKCPPGTYQDSGDQSICNTCHKSCADCDGESNIECNRCKKNAVEYEGICFCNDGYYADSNADCQPCHPECASCQGYLASQCIECKPNAQRTNLDTYVSSCQCKQKYYWDVQKAQCEQCHDTCKNCNSDSKNQCSQCISKAQLIPTTDGNYKCECGSDQYSLFNPFDCMDCHQTCKGCTKERYFDCKDCRIHSKLVNGECICDEGYYRDSSDLIYCKQCSVSCKTCKDSADKCIFCKNEFAILTHNNECKCIAGYYMDEFGYCIKCHPSCQECIGGEYDQCTLCHLNQLPSTSLEPMFSCNCPSGTYRDDCNLNNPNCNLSICLSCDPSCQTCINETNQCSSCPPNTDHQFFQRFKQCACAKSFFPKIVQGRLVCLKCDYTCKECYGPLPTQCSNCEQNAFMYLFKIRVEKNTIIEQTDKLIRIQINENTVNVIEYSQETVLEQNNEIIFIKQNICQCQLGFYLNALDKSKLDCQPCNIRCKECINETSEGCTDCNTGGVLSKNQTVSSCEAGQKNYEEPDNPGTYAQCHITCEKCIGSSEETQCTLCRDDSYLVPNNASGINLGKCVCIDGTYRNTQNNTSTCDPCSSSCKTCSSGLENSCVTCRNNATLTNGYCVCNPAYYMDTHFQCSQCDKFCASCSESPACITCIDNAEKDSESGTCSCKKGYYYNNQYKSCLPCNLTCETCEQKAEFCTDCYPDSNFTSNKCECKVGTYRDFSYPRICQICQPQCKTCSDGDSCDLCFNNASIDKETKLCICDQGYYWNQTELKCSPCYVNCKTCSGPDYDDCDSCFTNSAVKSGQCVCLTRFYQSSDPKICLNCDNSCESCVGSKPEECTQCKTIYFTFIPNQNQTPATDVKNNQVQTILGTCECKPKFFYDSNYNCSSCDSTCASCNGGQPNNCTSCIVNATLTKYNTCDCNLGYFFNIDKEQCEKCHEKCKNCIGYSDSQCLDCKANAQNKLGKCECVDGYYYDESLKGCTLCDLNCGKCNSKDTCNICKDNAEKPPALNKCLCKKGFFQDGRACRPCSPSCFSCNAATPNSCLECHPNAELVSNQTSQQECQCKSGFFQNSNNLQECLPCQQPCLQCKDSATNCIGTCGLNAQLINNQCQCISGYYMSNQFICVPCDQSCRQCLGPNANQCVACYSDFVISNTNTCVCRDGFYLPLDKVKCQQCHSDCDTCVNQSNNCLICSDQNKTVSINSNNISNCVCKTGFYQQGSNCKPCTVPYCDSCTSTKCLQCAPGATLSSITGFCSCPDNVVYSAKLTLKANRFGNTATKQCQQCDPKCYLCFPGQPSNCLTCLFDNIGDGTIQTPAPSATFPPGKNSGPRECLCPSTHKWNILYPLNKDDSKYAEQWFCQKINICHSSCISCNAQKVCTKCHYLAFVDTNNNTQCICQPGSYRDPSNPFRCLKCDESCQECTGPNPNQCTNCPIGALITLNSQTSTEGTCQCKDGWEAHNCLQGYCRKCHISCKKCNGQSQNNCKQCYPNASLSYDPLDKTSAYCVCNQGFYPSIDFQDLNQICLPCHNLGQTCSGPLESDILKCKDPNASVVSGKVKCNQRYYMEGEVCLKCYSNCLRCTGPSNIQCIECPQNFILNINYCEPAPGYYAITEGSIIVGQCHSTCYSCRGPQINQCTICYPNAKLNPETKQCLCVSGYYQRFSKCYPCHPSCKTCINDYYNGCSSCQENSSFNSNERTCSCTNGFELQSFEPYICRPQLSFNIAECKLTLESYVENTLMKVKVVDSLVEQTSSRISMYVSFDLLNRGQISSQCAQLLDVSFYYINQSEQIAFLDQQYIMNTPSVFQKLIVIPEDSYQNIMYRYQIPYTELQLVAKINVDNSLQIQLKEQLLTFK
ncbi:zinc finger lsd1 subclass family protein, putative, partial [Ichthyophthirius multifiliis]